MQVLPPRALPRVPISQLEDQSADVTTALAVWPAVALTALPRVDPTAHRIVTLVLGMLPSLKCDSAKLLKTGFECLTLNASLRRVQMDRHFLQAVELPGAS